MRLSTTLPISRKNSSWPAHCRRKHLMSHDNVEQKNVHALHQPFVYGANVKRMTRTAKRKESKSLRRLV